MMTPRRISKLIQLGDADALLDEVLANGRPLPIAARLRLGEPGSIEAAALAFGLQRSIELSGWTGTPSLEALDRLRSLQAPSGAFGGICSTSAAIRALAMLLDSPGLTGEHRDTVAESLDRAVHAMFCVLTMPVMSSFAVAPDDLDRAMVLWQLSDLALLRSQLNLDAVQRDLIQGEPLSGAARAVLAMAGAITVERRAA